MNYSLFAPNALLRHLTECYWIVEGTDISQQKIIPDGFTEIIFHFGDPYRIIQSGSFELQSHSIAAGQLCKPIFLQPTGYSGVLGVKFKPTGIWKLLGLNMSLISNQTVSLDDVIKQKSGSINEQLKLAENNAERIRVIEKFLLGLLNNPSPYDQTDLIIQDLHKSQGQISIQNLSASHKISQRKMERVFLERVGVSPKLYSRLIRFTYVFKLLNQQSLSKSEISYLSGYFDQAHFNKEFREFTGESPEAYFGQDHSFSNFFLNR